MIVDNITYLKTQATDTAKEALPLMKKLNELKKKYGLSILALAHTPKRNMANPLSKNDLAGSKHLANFADSIFAIGESFKDKQVRYLKHLKARATEIRYDSDNVILCEITKDHNFLAFNFIEFTDEREHLRTQSDTEKQEIDTAIIDAKKANPSISNYQIAKDLNTNKMKVKRILERNGFSNT